jgi:hypothetical protein
VVLYHHRRRQAIDVDAALYQIDANIVCRLELNLNWTIVGTNKLLRRLAFEAIKYSEDRNIVFSRLSLLPGRSHNELS